MGSGGRLNLGWICSCSSLGTEELTPEGCQPASDEGGLRRCTDPAGRVKRAWGRVLRPVVAGKY